MRVSLLLRSYGSTELRKYGVTEIRSYGSTELRKYGVTEVRCYGSTEYGAWEQGNTICTLCIFICIRAVAVAVAAAAPRNRAFMRRRQKCISTHFEFRFMLNLSRRIR
jgi:hypothetical protein